MNNKIVIKTLPRQLAGGFGHRFWCPFCSKWHTHGIGNGHRVEHCYHSIHKEILSPFVGGGYIVKIMPKKDLIEIKKEIETYLKWEVKLKCQD